MSLCLELARKDFPQHFRVLFRLISLVHCDLDIVWNFAVTQSRKCYKDVFRINVINLSLTETFVIHSLETRKVLVRGGPARSSLSQFLISIFTYIFVNRTTIIIILFLIIRFIFLIFKVIVFNVKFSEQDWDWSIQKLLYSRKTFIQSMFVAIIFSYHRTLLWYYDMWWDDLKSMK